MLKINYGRVQVAAVVSMGSRSPVRIESVILCRNISS
jgi:hypothetical protein